MSLRDKSPKSSTLAAGSAHIHAVICLKCSGPSRSSTNRRTALEGAVFVDNIRASILLQDLLTNKSGMMTEGDNIGRLICGLIKQTRDAAESHWDHFCRLAADPEVKGIQAEDARHFMQHIHRGEIRMVRLLMEQAALKAIRRFLSVLDGEHQIQDIPGRLHLFAGRTELSKGQLHEQLREWLRPIP